MNPAVTRLITWLPVGGIERRLVAIVPRLARRGWRMKVICLREEGPLAQELRDAGVKVEVCPFPSRLSPPAIWKLRALLQGTDIAHAHMYRSNIPGTIAARLAGVPVRLGQIHNVDGWDNGRQVMLDRAVARLRSGTIAVSRAVQQDVMARLGQPEERVPILYNGVDTDRFQPRPTVGDGIRRDLGVLDSQVLFLVPARLHPQKNPLGVLDAFHRLGAGDRARLVFAGGGKLEAQLRAKVAELRMENQVTILGNRDDMDALYQAADVVVLSSFREGFSNAVVEALACGKPVVGSDVGGNREAVDRPEVGWIHPPGEPEALLRDLEEALAAGRDGLARRAAACRRRGEDFSLDAMVEQTHRLYARLLQREPQ